MSLEEILRQYRESEDLSMQEFADRCGLSKGYISMLEKGRHPQNSRPLVPSINTIRHLADGMNISVDALLSAIDADTIVSVNNPAPCREEYELTYNEQALIRDYRDASPEIREAAASMLKRSADRSREDRQRSS